MHTLIFNGSPRASGDTMALIGALTDLLPGQVDRVDAYRADIRPCVDCRYCWTHPGCCVQDGWQALDAQIRAADNLVIASPLYFSQLTGPLLSLLSRAQSYYTARRFQGQTLIDKSKRGGIVLVGGGDGKPDPARDTAASVLRILGARRIGPLALAHRTNHLPAAQDPEAAAQVAALGAFLRGGDHPSRTRATT